MSPPLVGILMGGASSRMGGRPKGLLDAGAGESIVARLARIAREGSPAGVVLVGDLDAYDALGVPRIHDASRGDGPLAGLASLLAEARGADVVALACDLPRVAPSIVHRLIAATPGRTIAPHVDGFWQPLCARYAASARDEVAARLARGERALQALLRALDAERLSLDPDEAATMLDWDTPEDVSGSP